MRTLNTFAALIALGWLIAVVIKQAPGRIHWSVLGYLLSQALFIAAFRWANWKIGRLAADDPTYKQFYGVAAIPAILFMLAIAWRHSMEHGRFYGFMSAYVSASFAVGVGLCLRPWVLSVFRLSALTPTIRNHFILASVLLAAGCATLLSLAAPSGDIETATKVALGLYWSADGFYRFAWAIAMLNPHLRTVARFDWIPIALALVMAVGLSHKLNSSQKELGFQSLPEVQAIEQVVEEPLYE